MPVLVPGIAVTGLAAAGLAVAASALWAPRPETAGAVPVAAVQPGVLAGPENRLARGERLTRELAGRRPALVVWGESSVGYDLDDRPDVAGRLAALAAEAGAPLLVNIDARDAGTGAIRKSSVVVGPGGPTGQRYVKTRLVPFGEYVPLRGLLGWVGAVSKAAAEDRGRGTGTTVLDLDGLRTGPLICFESAFPDLSRQLAAKGAEVIVYQSSTSSFQHSWAPAQHSSLAALRAAETGRSTLHTTLTGTTAAYGPTGRPLGEPLPVGASDSAVYRLPRATGTTLYVRYGDWVPLAAAAVVAGWLAAGAVRRVLRGSPPGPA